MGHIASARLRFGSEPKFDGVSVSAARGTGNRVCASSYECHWEDTGNGVCGSSRGRLVSSLWRVVVSLRDWWVTSVSAAPGIGAVETLYGSWHWKQGVSVVKPVARQFRMLRGNWSGNEGGESP